MMCALSLFLSEHRGLGCFSLGGLYTQTIYDSMLSLADILKLRFLPPLFLATLLITSTSSSVLIPFVLSLEATPIVRTTLSFSSSVALMLDVMLHDCQYYVILQERELNPSLT